MASNDAQNIHVIALPCIAVTTGPLSDFSAKFIFTLITIFLRFVSVNKRPTEKFAFEPFPVLVGLSC